jgi:hypothetical protein
MCYAKLSAGIFAIVLASLSPYFAQAQENAVSVFGPIESVDGKTITARNGDGSRVTFDATGRIVSNQPIALSDLTAGLSVAFDTFDRNGGLFVTHVHTQGWLRAPGTFATRPLRSDPAGTRHLGVIRSVEPIDGGIRMTVDHEGGESSVTVDVLASVPILYHNREETEAALRPGILVMATAARRDDGSYGSGFVTVEVDGAKPVEIPE